MAGSIGFHDNENKERKNLGMKNIKFTLVGLSIFFASLALSAPSYAGMIGGMMGGSNGHHGGYGGYDHHHGAGYDNHHGNGAHHGGEYDNHHGAFSDDSGSGWGRGSDNRPRDRHFGDAGAGHDGGRGQRRQRP